MHVPHHEITEKLTWKPGAAFELRLHGIRNGLYAVVFISFGFFQWRGALAWVFAAILQNASRQGSLNYRRRDYSAGYSVESFDSDFDSDSDFEGRRGYPA